MRKVSVVIINRANYGRIKSVLHAISAHPDLELNLLIGASALVDKYGNFMDVLHSDGFEANATLYSTLEGTTPEAMVNSTGLLLIELSTVFSLFKPDIVVAIADRYEAMATAIAGAYMNIPVAHVQGGEITGSIDESVRHAITKMSHIHFPATQASKERLLKLGEAPETIHFVGCPSIDVIADFPLDFNPDDIAFLHQIVPGLDLAQPYILLIQHPVTTEFMDSTWQIRQTLDALDRVKKPIIFLHPNVDAGSDAIMESVEQYKENGHWQHVHLVNGFPVELYAKLMKNCACIVGNSSSAIREGAYLGVPAVNIGSRQRGRERGTNVVDVPYEAEAIKCAILSQIEQRKYASVILYGDGKAGKRIANVLANCDLNIQKILTY